MLMNGIQRKPGKQAAEVAKLDGKTMARAEDRLMEAVTTTMTVAHPVDVQILAAVTEMAVALPAWTVMRCAA